MNELDGLRVLVVATPGEQSDGLVALATAAGAGVSTCGEAEVGEHLDGVDVVVVAGAPHGQEGRPNLSSPIEDLPAVVLVGIWGGMVADELGILIGRVSGCPCLGPWSLVPPADSPLLLGAEFVGTTVEREGSESFYTNPGRSRPPARVATFDSYRELPDYPGLVVCVDDEIWDLPGVDILLGGDNSKGADYAAVVRQGKVVTFGFDAPISDWLPATAQLFLGAIAVAHEHRHEQPVVGRVARPRLMEAEKVTQLWKGEYPESTRARIVRMSYPSEVATELLVSSESAAAWWADSQPYLRTTRVGLMPDRAAVALGLPVDEVSSLVAAVLALESAETRSSAREFLENSTWLLLDDSDWQGWLDAHRDELVWTEWGGQRFVWSSAPLHRPDGLTLPVLSPPQASAALLLREGTTRLILTLPPGCHAYNVGSTEGIPLSLSLDGEPVAFSVEPTETEISRHAVLTVSEHIDPDRLAQLRVRVQLCDDTSCYPPAELVCTV